MKAMPGGITGLALAVLLALAGPARATDGAELFRIDQRFGAIDFSVGNLGLFESRGEFRRFAGELTIDEAHPERTSIAVTIDCRSVEMPWAQAAAMLRGTAYLDVAQYPISRFSSTRVVSTAPDRFTIAGVLQLRGVSRPVVLQAALVGPHPAPEQGAETIVYLASSPDVANVTGSYFYRCRPATPTREAQNDADARRLWDVSAQLAGIAA